MEAGALMALPPGFVLEQPTEQKSTGLPPPGFELEKPQAPAGVGSGLAPGNAGIRQFATGVAGLPVDTIENLLNIPPQTLKAGLMAAGRYDLANKIQMLTGSFGGSESMRNALRGTSFSADNPNPEDTLATAQYDLAARGGGVPGGFLPALASMAAEKLGGKDWAGVGAMLPAAARQAAANIPRPAISPQAQALAKEDVSLTPGQMVGGGVKRAEDAATSVPVLGDAIKGAQRRGIESFSNAAINRALEPIGDKLPAQVKGNAAIEYARTKLGDAYEELLPSLKGDLHAGASPVVPAQAGTPGVPVPAAQAGRSLKQDLDNIRSIGQNLPEPQRGQLGRIIDREVESRFTQAGRASGETLKQIESELGRLSKDFGRSDNYDTRTLGSAVKEVQNSLRRMVERVNPDYQGELSKINEGYANFKIAQKAAVDVGAVEGLFTPAQLHRAVKAQDISKDKARFAEGNARMQDLTAAGKAVLPSSVPDSGTPYRAALMYALAHPLKAGAIGVPVSLASTLYSPMGQSAMQNILTGVGQAKPLSLTEQILLLQQQERGNAK